MRRTHLVGGALLLMVVGGSALAQAQGDRGRGRGEDQKPDQRPQQPARVSPEEQKQRVHEQEQRTTQYRQHLDQQVRVVQQQTAQLQTDRRTAQYRVQQEYAARLREQQTHLTVARDYSRDPYINTPHSYRYTFGGVSHQTNQYGADVLRAAVNNGYQQGFRAGEADRLDHRSANYQSTIAYRDANYGYEGNYVDRSDYNYYFREGFRRGFDDGFSRRSQFGSNQSILGSLMTSILGFQSIR